MTDEQINKLFDLKQKLDAGIITKDAFDKEVSVLKGETPAVSSTNIPPSEKVEKLQQLKTLFDDGLISLEEMDKLRNEIINEKPAITPTQKNEKKESGFNWWIVVGAVILVAIIVILAVVNSDKSIVESTGEATDDEYYTEVATVQQEEPVYQEPEWTPSCGEWELGNGCATLRMTGYAIITDHPHNVAVKYFPNDRFEFVVYFSSGCVRAKFSDLDGKAIDIKTRSQRIDGYDRVVVDNPESIQKIYHLLNTGGFKFKLDGAVNCQIGGNGCGLADFVWHKITENDPYTNKILGKSTDGQTYTNKVYDEDQSEATNGMSQGKALELIIRSELGDENATQELEEELGNELQRLLTQ
ncbi:MAG: hypothetical protein ACSW8I_09155 [bacterium]